MSQTTAVEPVAPPAAPVAARIGQATAIEQSRAVAEVQAAIVVAQQCPRHLGVARTEMQQSCQMAGLAERAFYQYPRSGKNVSGPSVHLARELARCWGNVQYGIAELRRDDDYGESEMQAWAWDVQTNARSSQTFIVPHRRDKRGGAEKLTDLRDIYENNANMGARRLREAIFSILPPWFVEEAKELCYATLEKGDGKPLEERIAGAIEVFKTLGVSVDRLEQKLGRSQQRWTVHDIAQLLITHRSIQRGEITIDDEFPPARVTVDEILPPSVPPATAADDGDRQDPASPTHQGEGEPPEGEAGQGAPPDPDGTVDPTTWNAAEWRAQMSARRIKVTDILKAADEISKRERNLDGPGTIDDLADRPDIALAVARWMGV